ncbi:uncharacterized protein [Euwallacea fornicatus]|uniref:uncharacterized protein n=1 Tax=Euwallacea fornicatus TaxID=995702 RepID=UPI00338EA9E4
MQYIKFYLFCAFILNINIMYVISSEKFIVDHAKFNSFYSSTSADVGESTRKKIDNVAKLLRRCVRVSILVSITATTSVCFTWIPLTSRDLEMVTKWIKRWITEDSIVEQLLFWWIVISTASTIIPSITMLFYYLYVIVITIVKTLVLTDKLESFKLDHGNERIIMEHIRDFTQTNLQIKTFATQIAVNNQQAFIGYMITGLSVAVYSLYCIYSVRIADL